MLVHLLKNFHFFSCLFKIVLILQSVLCTLLTRFEKATKNPNLNVFIMKNSNFHSVPCIRNTVQTGP